jgi:hypothetical protein
MAIMHASHISELEAVGWVTTPGSEGVLDCCCPHYHQANWMGDHDDCCGEGTMTEDVCPCGESLPHRHKKWVRECFPDRSPWWRAKVWLFMWSHWPGWQRWQRW